jgi:hypothetical protein
MPGGLLAHITPIFYFPNQGRAQEIGGGLWQVLREVAWRGC